MRLWRRRVWSGSIYDFVLEHIDAAGRWQGGDADLPDEPRGLAARWAAGALDGSFTRHAAVAGDPVRVARVVQLLETAADRPLPADRAALEHELAQDGVVQIALPVVDELVRRPADAGRMQELGLELATGSRFRGAVKLGLVLLGATRTRDLAPVRVLGAHEEFTLFAATALCLALDDPATELRLMAEKVDGWGRVACVERLAGTHDPAIRDWVLREGYQTSLMPGYLVHAAATTGGLLDALRQPTVDRDLFSRAGEILSQLAMGGMGVGIDEYDDAPAALRAYLQLLPTQALTLDDLRAVTLINAFLTLEDGWDARLDHNWTYADRSELTALSAQFVTAPEWADRIAVAFMSEDPVELRKAFESACDRGIDTFDVLVHALRQDPLDGDWQLAWRQADDVQRARTLADLACEVLPLAEIASGPSIGSDIGDMLGIGDQWRPHFALGCCLDALEAHPGIGSDLVATGLRSPVIRNRSCALGVLTSWSRSSWPDSAPALINALAQHDPDPELRAYAAEVLATTR
jgi:hypothetical protein